MRPYESYRPLIARCSLVRYVHWPLDPAAVDEGVGDEAQNLAARALTALGNVLFLDSRAKGGAKWEAEGPDTWRLAIRLGPLGFSRRWGLCYTRDPRVVPALFDDPEFPWHLRGQLALIFPEGLPPQSLDAATILTGVDRQDITAVDHCTGYFRPGDDGDFAELGIESSGELERFVVSLR